MPHNHLKTKLIEHSVGAECKTQNLLGNICVFIHEFGSLNSIQDLCSFRQERLESFSLISLEHMQLESTSAIPGNECDA